MVVKISNGSYAGTGGIGIHSFGGMGVEVIVKSAGEHLIMVASAFPDTCI